MTIKTILAAAGGGSANDGTLELACQLAERFKAHLEAIHVRADVRDILVNTSSFGTPVSGEFIDSFMHDADGVAAKAKASFEAIAGRHGIPFTATRGSVEAASAAWREETGSAADFVPQRARYFDLIVLGRSERVVDEPHSDTVEQTLLQSGRPVLLAPEKTPGTLGGHVVIGWNGSPAAVRALAASIPFLEEATTVSVLTIGAHEQTLDADAVEYLAWHGIAANFRELQPVSGVGPGELLLSTAHEEGADLLVMGGYSHTRWHEMLFGGATRQIVGMSLLPVLITH